MATEKIKDNQFLVALEGIDLTATQRKAIASGIRQVVMRELALIDTKGDLALSSRAKLVGKKLKPGPIIDGIYASVRQDIQQLLEH
jgi:hypothetical protein